MHISNGWPLAGALLCLVTVLATATGCAASSSSTQGPRTQSTSSPSVAPCSTPAVTSTEPCGVSFQELRRLNLRYADRDPFSGDGRAILKDEARVKTALKGLVKPAREPIGDALVRSGFSADNIVVSTNAVRMAGVAFAVEADGGCIFGGSYDGKLTVDVGGYIKDGVCLAAYGH